MKQPLPYQGVEQGPIRPPSEAYSLLLRVTRHCPWNRCTFCPIYKDERFSLRPVEDVLQDIDAIYRHCERLRTLVDSDGTLSRAALHSVRQTLPAGDWLGFSAAVQWFLSGMESVFLQDADSLVIKPVNLLRILEHLRQRFPPIHRITSYARSHTVARMSLENLRALRAVGLNRLHLGLESGSDQVLARVRKGATKAMHIVAGRKVKEAGIELSEYYMPGLGGQDYSREHALESADALNQINPDFIRLRTLAIPQSAPLYADYAAGRFRKCNDVMVVAETLLFLEHLQGITSLLKSDHSLNLFIELAGRLPDDQPRLVQLLRDFLAADPERQRLFQVGRRCGTLSRWATLDEPAVWANLQTICCELGITAENVDTVTDELMRRFI